MKKGEEPSFKIKLFDKGLIGSSFIAIDLLRVLQRKNHRDELWDN